METSGNDINKHLPGAKNSRKAYFFPDSITLFAFTMFSLLAINFFVELADGELDSRNFLFFIAVIIGLPFYGIAGIVHDYTGATWQAIVYNPWTFIAVFGYFYLLSILISRLVRWTRTPSTSPEVFSTK